MLDDAGHARYIALITALWTNARLSDADLDELTTLHSRNMARVNKITTEEPAR